MSEARDDSQNDASGAEKILRFWFADEPGSRESKLQSRWFFPTPEFDRLCTTRFLASYEDAADGRLEDWKNEPRSCLALVLLLDQFPRNMFRGTARAFATDAKARELSHHAISAGFDRKLSPIMRMFLYLPLEHSENLNDQLESVRLTSELVSEKSRLPRNSPVRGGALGSIPAIWKVPRSKPCPRKTLHAGRNELSERPEVEVTIIAGMMAIALVPTFVRWFEGHRYHTEQTYCGVISLGQARSKVQRGDRVGIKINQAKNLLQGSDGGTATEVQDRSLRRAKHMFSDTPDDALLYLMHVEFVPVGNLAELARGVKLSTQPDERKALLVPVPNFYVQGCRELYLTHSPQLMLRWPSNPQRYPGSRSRWSTTNHAN